MSSYTILTNFTGLNQLLDVSMDGEAGYNFVI